MLNKHLKLEVLFWVKLEGSGWKKVEPQEERHGLPFNRFSGEVRMFRALQVRTQEEARNTFSKTRM